MADERNDGTDTVLKWGTRSKGPGGEMAEGTTQETGCGRDGTGGDESGTTAGIAGPKS